MRELPSIMSKKMWFLLFNGGTIVYVIASGSVRWDATSLVSLALALLFVNCMALIAARKYKGYKGWK